MGFFSPTKIDQKQRTYILITWIRLEKKDFYENRPKEERDQSFLSKTEGDNCRKVSEGIVFQETQFKSVKLRMKVDVPRERRRVAKDC